MIVVQVVTLGLLSTLIGCSAKGEQRPDRPLVESAERSDDELLYQAVLDVLAEEGRDLHIADRERQMVLTTWSEFNREVRHRYVTRVIRSNAGLVLTVDSRYERQERGRDGPSWVEATDPYTARDKRRDEQRIGTAIQARFRALGGGK